MLESNQETFLSVLLQNGVNQLSKNSNLFPNILNKKNDDILVEEPFMLVNKSRCLIVFRCDHMKTNFLSDMT